jgi:hypothetical protein
MNGPCREIASEDFLLWISRSWVRSRSEHGSEAVIVAPPRSTLDIDLLFGPGEHPVGSVDDASSVAGPRDLRDILSFVRQRFGCATIGSDAPRTRAATIAPEEPSTVRRPDRGDHLRSAQEIASHDAGMCVRRSDQLASDIDQANRTCCDGHDSEAKAVAVACRVGPAKLQSHRPPVGGDGEESLVTVATFHRTKAPEAKEIARGDPSGNWPATSFGKPHRGRRPGQQDIGTCAIVRSGARQRKRQDRGAYHRFVTVRLTSRPTGL